jgi:hypothetical protein
MLTALAGWRGYAAIALIAFASGGLGTGYVQRAICRAEVAALEKARADEAAEQARTALAEMVRLQTIIAGIDADYSEELKHATADNDKLRADLRAGALRLSVRTTGCVPAAATGAGLGDGAGRAELDARDADHLVALAGRGDRAIVRLRACQAYARAVSTPAME